MARRLSGYIAQGRAKKVPGGSKQAVERNADTGGRAVGFREMTERGLLLALASANGKRATAIERELSRRGIAHPNAGNGGMTRAPASEAPRDGANDRSAAGYGSPSEHFPELPGYKVDALGRQRPDHSHPGRVSQVERIAISGERIKRDDAFRARVLEKYGTACVICGYDVHVEAAHLTPKHQLSDDRVENGAPLCPNHHWELNHGILSTDQVRRARDIRQAADK